MKKRFILLPLMTINFVCTQQRPTETQQNINASTAMENVYIFDENFYIPQLDRYRKIWLYLPPDYFNSNKHYPVLYMHDGQNLFDDLTSFVGEWGVDEVLNEMFQAGFPGLIVVGIEHGAEERLNEYSPWKRKGVGGGLGDKHAEFLVQTLKPAIDKNLRTLPGRENTDIGGSSMGGLISFYVSLKYPEIFSRSLIFSPAFWFADKSYALAEKTEIACDFRMYFLAGGKEYPGRDLPKATKRMVDILKANGLTEYQYRFVSDPEGIHNEAFWHKYFADAVGFLFDPNLKTCIMWEEENNKLIKSFEFNNFVEAFAFMIKVAFAAEKMNHHPYWVNVYNRVDIQLSTHDAGDVVTEKDHKFAGQIDKIYHASQVGF
jgi:predicted alpha/beta superfamily hydrolase/pterin-4a-carbinolamine dehydratase